MRIGLYITALGPGGAERVVSRLSNILKNHGHSVYVILSETENMAYPLDGTLIDLGIRSEKSFFKRIAVLVKRIRALKRIKKNEPLDVVISFLDGANIVNILAKDKHTKAYASIRNHQSSILLNKSRFGVLLHRISMGFLYRQAAGIINVSKVVAIDTGDLYKIPRHKLTVLYNPYDIALIQQSSLEDAPRDFLSFIEDKSKVICSTGRLQHQKGFWHLLKVFSQLSPNESKIGLVIIGTGEQDAALRELARDLAIEDSVYFAGYQKNPFSIMKHCDWYILSSLYEGFPNAMVEAMCLGLPVIATDCKSGPREILAPELDIAGSQIASVFKAPFGVLMPPFSSQEDWSTSLESEELLWGQELSTMVNDDMLVQHYSEKSITRVEDFSEESCYLKLMNIMGTM